MGFREREKGRLAPLKSKLFSAMEREHEMEADVVSLLYIAPAANREFMGRVTSPATGAGSLVAGYRHSAGLWPHH